MLSQNNTVVKVLYFVSIFICFMPSIIPIALGVKSVGGIEPAAHQIQALTAKSMAVLGVLLALIGLYEAHLWKIRVKNLAVCPQPCLIGTWKGELRSNYVVPGTTSPIPPKEVFIAIRQTLSTVSVRFLTDESNSNLLGGSLIRDPDGLYSLTGTYISVPKTSLQATSPIHFGALLLRVSGEPADRLEGEYWTNRSTKGEIILSVKSSKLHNDFTGAVADNTYKGR